MIGSGANSQQALVGPVLAARSSWCFSQVPEHPQVCATCTLSMWHTSVTRTGCCQSTRPFWCFWEAPGKRCGADVWAQPAKGCRDLIPPSWSLFVTVWAETSPYVLLDVPLGLWALLLFLLTQRSRYLDYWFMLPNWMDGSVTDLMLYCVFTSAYFRL